MQIFGIYIHTAIFRFRDATKQIQVIDPAYVDNVKEKVTEVFGEKSRENVYKQIEELLRDKKMASTTLREETFASWEKREIFVINFMNRPNLELSCQLVRRGT